MKPYDAVVVGGGAAGLCCAGFAAANGKRVLLLERGPCPGRKLHITGKGRCNITNNCTPQDFLQNVRTNPRFLYSAIHRFTPHDTIAFFEERGLPLKTERGNRVFPVSDSARDVVDVLTTFAVKAGAELTTGTAATGLVLGQGRIAAVQTTKGAIPTHAVVLATGGKSYPRTGSDGSGYQLAAACGHSIQPPKPSLVPLVAREAWCSELAGLSLRNVTLRLWKEGTKRPVFEELGEMLFTHFGVSGPLVLSASSHMQQAQGYCITIDLKPGLQPEQLDARLLRDFQKYNNKNLTNALVELLPKSLIPVAIELAGLTPQQKPNQLTRQQRLGFCSLLKAFPLTPIAFRPIEEAIITAGGVRVQEVDPGSMQSRLVPGLYFAGEILDVDAYTGGFNLQIAFSTARLAAEHL